MKVLMSINEMGTGGAEAVVAELAGALPSRGVDVTVASAGGQRVASLQEPHLTVPLTGRSPLGVLRTARALRGPIRAADLVHAHNVGSTVVARLAGGRKTPVVTTFHGVAEGDYKRAAQLLQRCSDHVVVVAGTVAERLSEAGLRRVPVSVITNAVSPLPVVPRDVARAALGLDPGQPVALCAARLVPQKRHDVLLRAWARLPGSPVLLLAGPGPLAEPLAAMVEELGLTGRVRLLGERRDIDVLLAAADAFVLASDWEGLPIALLEAMAAGVPLVVTAVDGVPDAVGTDAARLVPPRDDAALAAALGEVLDDEQLRASMSAAARRRAQELHSVDAMADAYAAVYADVLQLRRSTAEGN